MYIGINTHVVPETYVPAYEVLVARGYSYEQIIAMHVVADRAAMRMAMEESGVAHSDTKEIAAKFDKEVCDLLTIGYDSRVESQRVNNAMRLEKLRAGRDSVGEHRLTDKILRDILVM